MNDNFVSILLWSKNFVHMTNPNHLRTERAILHSLDRSRAEGNTKKSNKTQEAENKTRTTEERTNKLTKAQNIRKKKTQKRKEEILCKNYTEKHFNH